MIDYQVIWDEVTPRFRCSLDSIHGPEHWHNVEDVGLKMVRLTGADKDVVRLFAVLHDSCRVDDTYELTHGERAAEYAGQLRGTLFELNDHQFRLLQYACQWHAHGKVSADPTIGACWDADRLDLTRIGIMPDSKLLSTDEGKRIASELVNRSKARAH